jgi:hypothetical protein
LFLILCALFGVSKTTTVFGGVYWKYRTDGTVNSVGVSADGSYIVAGTWSESIFLLDKNGSLLWSHDFSEDVEGVAISGDGSRIVVCVEEWSSGEPDVYLFDILGNIIWQKDLVEDYYPRDVAISPDATYIVVGDERDTVHFCDISGTSIWNYTVGSLVDDVSTSTEGNYTAAGSWDNKLYFFDKAGNLLWSHDFGYFVETVSVSPEGGYVAAGNSVEKDVYLFDKNGSLLWKTPFYISIEGVSLSKNADKIAVASYEKVSVIDKATNIIYEQETEQSIEDIAITADGKFVAYGCGNYVYFFEPLPPSEITCKVFPTTTFLGGSVTVDGSISPQIGGAQVKLEYKLVTQEFANVTKTVTASSDGSFTDAFTPNATGQWKIVASWSGGAEHMASENEAFFVVNPPVQISLLSSTPIILYWHRQQWYCRHGDTVSQLLDMEIPTSSVSATAAFNPGDYWWIGHGHYEFKGIHTGQLSESILIEKGLWNLSIWAAALGSSEHFMVSLNYWDENHENHDIAYWTTEYFNSTDPEMPTEFTHSFDLPATIIPKGGCLGFIIYDCRDSYVKWFFDSTLHPSYLSIPPSIEFVDNVPPQISNPGQVPPTNIQPNQNVTVTVMVTDQGSEIYNVTLWYSIDNGTNWMFKEMTEITSGTYQSTIPGYEECTWVRYKISAFDNNGNQATKDNNGNYYIYHVIPEYQTLIILPVLIIATLLAFMARKTRKFHKRKLGFMS